jgi:hypothetical protein
MMIRTTIALLAATVLGACSGDESPIGNDPALSEGHAQGPHGGHILEVGSHVAHLEVLHDEDAGTLTIYVLGGDLETPLAIATAPQIKLATNDGPKVVKTEPQEATDGKSTVFTATNAALKGHVHGRVTVEIGGKTYNPELEHEDH